MNQRADQGRERRTREGGPIVGRGRPLEGRTPGALATVIRLTPAAGRTALPEGETPEAGPARRQFIRHGLPWQWAGQSLR